MQTRSHNRRLLLSLLVIALLGCGDSHDVEPVRGSVSIAGEPATAGQIRFSPKADGDNKLVGKSAFAEIQTNGTFVLGTYEEDDGAHVGKHRATLYDAQTKSSGTIPKLTIWDRYFEVTQGQEHDFKIEITSEQVRQWGETDD